VEFRGQGRSVHACVSARVVPKDPGAVRWMSCVEQEIWSPGMSVGSWIWSGMSSSVTRSVSTVELRMCAVVEISAVRSERLP